jgi:hypothetical protein
MLLAEVVAGMDLGFAACQDLLQLLDEVLQIPAGKFPAEPKYQSCYLAHGGESLGNLAGSLKGDLQNLPRETPPPFLFAVKPTAAVLPSSLSAASGLAPQIDPGSPRPQRGESRNASFPHQFNRLSA